MKYVVLLIVFIFSAEIFAGEIYYYKDSKGNFHFTDTPTDMLRYKPFNKKVKKKVKKRVKFSKKENVYDNLIKLYSKEFGFSFALIKAMVKAESDFNPYAVSPAGAIGLMQLMPETAKTLGVKNIWSPAENLYGGIKYMRFLTDFFNNDIRKAIAAYNSGLTTVMKAKGIPNIVETQNYVKRVIKYYYRYENRVVVASDK